MLIKRWLVKQIKLGAYNIIWYSYKTTLMMHFMYQNMLLGEKQKQFQKNA